MTKPTQEQIEAGLAVFADHYWDSFNADKFLILQHIKETLPRALTAAAEVGEKEVTPPIIKERCSRCHAVLGDMDKAMAESNRLWRAINCMNEDDWDRRAKMIMQQSLDGLTVGPNNRGMVQSTLAEHFEDIEAATIERCARVAESVNGAEFPVSGDLVQIAAKRIAAAIRALKDKP